MTSWLIYMNEKRPEVNAAEPLLKFGTLAKKLTENRWVLSEEEKKDYEN